MQSFSCGDGCSPSTRDLRERKRNLKENRDEKICESAQVRSDRVVGSDGIQFCRHASVELADSGAVWMARDQILAGVGGSGAQQNPVWGISRASGTPHVLAPPHDGALGADDARRAR